MTLVFTRKINIALLNFQLNHCKIGVGTYIFSKDSVLVEGCTITSSNQVLASIYVSGQYYYIQTIHIINATLDTTSPHLSLCNHSHDFPLCLYVVLLLQMVLNHRIPTQSRCSLSPS
jgi:hypothetical protein